MYDIHRPFAPEVDLEIPPLSTASRLEIICLGSAASATSLAVSPLCRIRVKNGTGDSSLRGDDLCASRV